MHSPQWNPECQVDLEECDVVCNTTNFDNSRYSRFTMGQLAMLPIFPLDRALTVSLEYAGHTSKLKPCHPLAVAP